ncbi:EAL domain-containing protein [Rugamonas sp. CCM 8940]|uniref:EAL domain-containing protein n=1 Tax=Rugamonas sp. CCM 8940 TaxID=2765359 RepID=UPI0018F5283C|nr:EAL domain-containing protein [Rugamonas sp. CCM 8940]MBJ7308775.1 EAL domain-containing protein [Rugamonas sp. CCM 8940]
MAALSKFSEKFQQLSLRARLLVGMAALVAPVLLAVLVVTASQQYLSSALQGFIERDNRIVELSLRASAALLQGGAEGPGRLEALRGVREDMRLAAAVAAEPLRGEAQDIGLLSYQAAAYAQLPARLAKLTEHASEAGAAAERRLGWLRHLSTLVALLAPLAALALGMALAFGVVRGIDRTLRECVAFARDVADGKLPKRLQVNSSSEFQQLVNTLNDLAIDARHNEDVRHQQAASLLVLERVAALRGACNTALAGAADEMAMLQGFCEALVDAGHYRLAWVGYARRDAEQHIEPVAHGGSDRDYVDQLKLSWGEDVRRRAAAGTAIVQRRILATSDVAHDPLFAAWRGGALPRGLLSCVAMPLCCGDEVLGALNLYDGASGRFDATELALLGELLRNLEYGIARVREASERQRIEALLDHRVSFDTLTGLANRVTLEGRLAQAAEQAKVGGKHLAALFIDLDRFKDVNDNFGHKVGDQMLAEVARLLESLVGDGATVARPGNDEFVVLLPGVESAAAAGALATTILARLDQPLPGGPPNVRPLASIGISLFPDDGTDPTALLRIADLAMQDAKGLGGNTFRFYAPAMNARMAARFSMEADLRQALEREELLMHYQPQVSLSNGNITGAEALMRWRHPSRGMVAPTEFIRLAEETGLVLPLGAWAINNVCAQLRAWRQQGLPVPPVAVNLSARQFHQKDLVQVVRAALSDNGLPPGALKLEVTESAVMHDVEAAVAILAEFKQLGVGISLDDFGTGYSSLSYLKRFPIDQLKIDRSFVRDVTTVPDDAAICNAVIGLAHNMHISVIAEGVETEGQMNYLRRRHCDEMQGFLFSKAVAPAAFAELLGTHKKLALPSDAAERILLILDDEVNIVKALARTLRPDGYRILTANNAAEALALLALHPVQVVLSDQRMPEMSGTEFLSRVKALYPETIRIILSGYTDLESVIDAINRGAVYRFFTKPWNDELLRNCIGEAFQQHRLMYQHEVAEQA